MPAWLNIAVTIGIAVAAGYLSSEISTQATIAQLRAEMAGHNEALASFERWREQTSNNRFTNLDGDRLRSYLESRINLHQQLPAHGEVLPRLTALEVRVQALEKSGER